MPNYGIWLERDVALDAPASTVDRDTVLDVNRVTLADHNRELSLILSPFADRVTLPQLAVRTGTSNRLQGLDELGRPKPVKGAGQYIVGLPMWKAGTAEAFDFWVQKDLTVRDYATSLDTMLVGDLTWMRDQLLAPLFYNGAGLPYANTKAGESFTVFGPANGDAQGYNTVSGPATDSHFSAQADPIDAAHNPFPAIYTDMVEHPENAGRIVAFVASDQMAAISLLPNFAPVDQAIVRIVPAAGSQTTDPLYAPGLNLPLSRAMTYQGVHRNTYIVEWPAIPSGYIVHVAVDAAEKALAWRESPNPGYQGFLNQGEPMAQFPYQQNNYVRQCGFGARNRVAAHVHRVGNASYAAPTAYPFPMA